MFDNAADVCERIRYGSIKDAQAKCLRAMADGCVFALLTVLLTSLSSLRRIQTEQYCEYQSIMIGISFLSSTL